MRGYINGIWLTQSGGKLHPAILPNLGSWVTDAAKCGFGVVLWTNLDQIAPEEIASLKSRKIIVKDHSLCKSSPLYQYFILFLNRGISGDKTAFAIASDILRMAILDLTDDNEYYIYTDPNDVKLLNLKASLNMIPMYLSNNSLGFSFYVEQVPGHPNMFHKRNDVLIAHKLVNPNFFRDYSVAYLNIVSQKHSEYVTPTTDRQAQELANTISNQTQHNLFQVQLTSPMPTVKAMFGDYAELSPIVHCLALLPHERMIENACTWLPRGDLSDELEELRLFGLEPIVKKNLTPKPVILSDGINAKPDISNSKKSSVKKNEFGFKKGFLL